MSSSDIHTPQPLEVNGLFKFFPEFVYRKGDSDPPPLGPFQVRGDSTIKRKERDVPVQRFLILKPEEGCALPKYYEYAVEYPGNLVVCELITFERKGSALRIRTRFSQKRKGVMSMAFLPLKDGPRQFGDYVLYEQQVEGTWIPIEVDGEELRP